PGHEKAERTRGGACFSPPPRERGGFFCFGPARTAGPPPSPPAFARFRWASHESGMVEWGGPPVGADKLSLTEVSHGDGRVRPEAECGGGGGFSRQHLGLGTDPQPHRRAFFGPVPPAHPPPHA